MTLQQQLSDYFETLSIETELKENLEKTEKTKKEILAKIIEDASESGVKTIEHAGIEYRIGYKTVYIATGGELKNPEKRRELFERIESVGAEKADKIVFKDSFFITEDGKSFEAKDAEIGKVYFQKLINSLEEEFRAKLIEDGLLSFYVVPEIKQIKTGLNKVKK